MKNNIHKKETFEDKFDRKYACWIHDHRKAWMFWKKRNRRLFRRKGKKEIKKRMKRIIDGHEIQVEEDTTAIYKDGELRGIYYGVTDSNIALRLFVNAIRTMDNE